MIGRTWAVAMIGLTGHLVEVEAHLAASLPAFTLVGLPDAALSEARDRVRAALSVVGLWPNRRITVNLSPATLPKAGSGFDLAVAVALLVGAGKIDADLAARTVHIGELGLDGRLRPVAGVLPAVASAVASGRARVVVPDANAIEARLVPGAEVLAADHVAQVAEWYGAQIDRPAFEGASIAAGHSGAGEGGSRKGDGSGTKDGVVVLPGRQRGPTADEVDLVDVIGQDEARRGLEVAAAGGHHLLMVGPPGTGKTMLASRLPGLLPDLTAQEQVEVTAVHSIAGTLDASGGLVRRPPFENPHHGATPAAVVGGGSGVPRPGAASRAHRGILFLDEAPHFSPAVLQSLREPLEHGELVVHRAYGTARYPARFQLVMAANPCPCGHYTGKGSDCVCRVEARRRYFSRLSGPLLDRVDVQLDVPPVRPGQRQGETTAAVAARVAVARETARARLRGTPWSTNAEVSGRWLRDQTGFRDPARQDIDRALERGWLSLRGADRVLRVAWTLADLAGADRPTRDHLGEALTLRSRTDAA